MVSNELLTLVHMEFVPDKASYIELDTAAERMAAEIVRLRQDKARLTMALQRIGECDDTAMREARTLHYDMRGWAREALAPR